MPRRHRVIAVTGASGFIGRRLVRRLAAEGYRVRILLRRPAPDLERLAAVVGVPGSLEDADSLTRLVAGADAVVHAAGLTRALHAADFDRVNAEATERLTAVCAARPQPPRIVLLSSLAAREPGLSDYAASKRRAEAALAARPELDFTILRPPAVYGPGDTATLDIFRLLARGILPVPGFAESRVSLIYVDDLVAAILALLTTDAGRGATYELRDGCALGYSWREIAVAASRCLDRRVICVPVPRPALWLAGHISVVKCQLLGGVPRISPGKVRELCHIDWVCRNNPLAEQTDWVPEVGVNEGFRRTLGWYGEQGWL